MPSLTTGGLKLRVVSLNLAGRVRPALVCALVWCASITCSDLTSPSGGLASVGIAPVFSEQAAAVYADLVQVGLVVNNVHLRLDHADGTLAKDTTVSITPGQDSVIIEIVVSLNGTQESLKAKIDLRDGTIVLFSGTQNIVATAGALPGAPPPPIPVQYAGPGSSLTSILLGPADTAIRPGDSVVYRPSAKDAGGQAVTDFVLIWSVKDSTLGSISAAGVFKPKVARGQTWVMARTPNGIKDSAHVVFTPPATQIVKVSGDAQQETVDKNLPQPLVLEVQAVDNLPVPGVAVSCVPAGATLVTPCGVSDANGRVSLTLKLGTVAGAASLAVSTADVAAVTMTATATPDKAAKLVMAQQPSAAATSGTTLATQPKVQAQDQFGNAVNTAGLPVTVSLPGGSLNTLAGTQTVASDATGLVTYSGLKVLGPAGSVALTFSNDSLTSTTSSSIALAVGPAANLGLEGGSSVSYTAGSPNPSTSAFLVTDAGGNGVSGTGVHVVATVAALTLYDTTLVTDSTGRVRLNRLPSLASTGVYTITGSSGSLTGSPVALTLTVTPGAPDHLRFFTSPAGSTGGVAFGFTVDVSDAHNNRVVGSTTDLTVAIKAGTGAVGAVLGPNAAALTKPAVAGAATFSVTIDKAAVGYQLTASASGLTGATSAAFAIAVGPSAQIVKVAGDGLAALPGNEPPQNPKVQVTDAGGNAKAGVTVAFAIVSGGGTLSANSVDTDVNGFAISDWHLGAKGSGAQSVSASVTGLTPALFTATLAEKLALVQDPQASPQSGIPMSPQPKIQLQDAAGNQAKVSGVSVGAKIIGNFEIAPVLSGTTPVTTDANGEAVFTDLTITGNNALLGLGPKLGFGATLVDSVYSGNLALQAGSPASIVNWSGDYQRMPAAGTKTVRARVRDASFNTITTGLNVTFTVIEGPCSFGGGSSTTVAIGADSTASATATITGSLTSCTIEAKYTFPPPPPCCDGLPPLTKYARLFVVPDAFWVWTGATDGEWSTASNWYDFSVPGTDKSVFVPRYAGTNDGSTWYPTLSTTSGAKTLLIEAGAGLFMNGHDFEVVDTLFADGPVHDGGALIVTGTAAELRGTVYGLMRVGSATSCLAAATSAFVIGALGVDSIEVNCTLVVAENFPVDIGGQLRVTSTGQFTQSKGTITVAGDASFNGNFSSFTGGLLDLKGNFSHSSDCEGRWFKAEGTHITRFSGAPSSPLILFWDAYPDCTSGSRFATLEFATSENGVEVQASSSLYRTPATAWLVKSGSSLTMATGSTLDIPFTTGTVDVESGATLNLASGVNTLANFCLDAASQTLVLTAGANNGPFHCTRLAALTAQKVEKK